MKRHLGLSLLLIAALPMGLCAQDYSWERLDDLGIKYKVFQKLKQIPLKLGTSHPDLRARYEPGDAGDYIWGTKGRYNWDLRIFEFVPAAVVPLTGKDAPKSQQEAEDMARQMMAGKRSSSSFREFVTGGQQKDDSNYDRKFDPKAKGLARKGNKSGTKPPYTWWEYTDNRPMHSPRTGENYDQLWYNCAAVYELDGREIALVTSMPLKRGNKLDSKYMRWVRSMLLSVTTLKEREMSGETADEQLFEHADTPERKKAVEAALANISGLDHWDIFTTESYIVLYSWPPKKNDKKRKNFLAAKDIAESMDRMRELYKEYYPPKEGTVFPYSVMRVCSTGEEFQKYGESGAGVVGWFSPVSKELVLFLSNDKEMTKTVAFHEGWHQYSDTYFPDVELQRWFDEGTGDFFGSFEWSGGRWRYDVSKMRKISIKTIVNTNAYQPLAEIVTWNKDKFYGDKAADYYAQGYAMVDFLQRGGDKRTSGWDDAWGEILETYRTTMLETKNPKKAVAAAFANVDWDRFTKAWVKWVKSY